METDKRFAHVANDPKFRRIPKGERKVKIDKRFQSMFKDKKFKVKYTVDKRGRPVSHSTTEDLKRYYHIDSEDDEESEEEPKKVAKRKGKKPKAESNSDSDQSSSSKEEVETDNEDANSDNDEEKESEDDELVKTDKTDIKVSDKVRKKLKNLTVDYARGEGQLLSESSSDDEDSEEDAANEVDQGIDHKWGELDADADRTDEITSRLAACNMDWDRIRAVDLMVLFNSFLPPGGSITSVAIYPSEFGKKRMAEEEIKGPAELVEAPADIDGDGNEEGSKYHMERLRQYQLNRLKYYYAVVTCNNPTTANKIYTECDGMEYESSATKIDLRFIPDDLSFDDDEPKEKCTQVPEVNRYKPRFFTTTALQQAKVDLTWDETNPERLEITEKLASGKIDDIADTDLQAYLASSSGEESEVENQNDSNEEKLKGKNAIEKYKLLLQEIESKEKSKEEKDVGMEITWEVDLQKKTEQLLKDKKTNQEDKTPFEEFLDKRKQKRKEKRIAKKQAAGDEESDGDDSDSDVPAGIDMNDPYFAEEFNKPEFQKTPKKVKKPASGSDSNSEDESRAQLELLLNDEDDNKKHFSLKKIQDQENESKSKKKRKNKKKAEPVTKYEDDFEVDVEDERFSALFTSHHYNIDPTDPHFKKTKNMEKLITEKIKRRNAKDDADVNSPKKKLKLENGNNSEVKNKLNSELSVLVKSVKRKAEAFKSKKK